MLQLQSQVDPSLRSTSNIAALGRRRIQDRVLKIRRNTRKMLQRIKRIHRTSSSRPKEREEARGNHVSDAREEAHWLRVRVLAG